MERSNKTRKKAWGSMIAIMALFCMLALTTYALVLSMVSVDAHLFETAQVKIELNGGAVVFDGADMNVEPGHAVKRDFTVENKGTVEVYYRLYLENVSGSLQDALNFEIYDGDNLLFSGNAADFNREHPCSSEVPLGVGETKTLTAVVTMKKDAGNTFQDGGITFDMTADAVQSKNNPEQEFE